MIKDHLGNVRMVLTEETKTDSYPAATMETANATIEEQYYGNLPYTRDNPPAGYPSNTPSGNAKIARINGSGLNTPATRIGPAIMLKVMAGDKFNVTVNSWWDQGRTTPGSPTNPLYDLIGAIGNAAGNVNGGHPGAYDIQTSTELNDAVTSYLSSQSSYDNTKAKAFINWLLLDERFNYVASSSGFEQVGASTVYTSHSFSDLPIDKNGYLYVFTSNATPNIDVFFDNLQVTHIHGPLVEEEHFYPFGLTMHGISSQALNFGGGESKKKFQGQEFAHDEFADGSGLDMYEFKYRMADPQTGRFWQIDPLAEDYEYNSTYAFSEDKVTTHIELEGLETEYINSFLGEAWDCTKSCVKWVNNNLNPFVPLAEGITGKSLNSNFTEDKPRGQSFLELGLFLVPEVKVESVIAKGGAEVIINTGEKQVVKNAVVGKQGEKIVGESLEKEFADKKVLNQVTGRFFDGTKTVIDNIVIDPKTNKAILTNETKTGTAKLSTQQARRHSGESVTLVGKNAGEAKGQIINTTNTTSRTSRVNVNTKEIKQE